MSWRHDTFLHGKIETYDLSSPPGNLARLTKSTENGDSLGSLGLKYKPLSCVISIDNIPITVRQPIRSIIPILLQQSKHLNPNAVESPRPDEQLKKKETANLQS